MEDTCGKYGGEEICIQVFVGKPEVGLPYVLIFPDMSSFSRLKLPSGRNLCLRP